MALLGESASVATSDRFPKCIQDGFMKCFTEFIITVCPVFNIIIYHSDHNMKSGFDDVIYIVVYARAKYLCLQDLETSTSIISVKRSIRLASFFEFTESNPYIK